MTLAFSMFALGLVLQSPKGAATFPTKSLILPPPPLKTVVLQMPAGFAWANHEVQLEKSYELSPVHWFMYGYATNGVPITVPYEDGAWYRLRALPKQIL